MYQEKSKRQPIYDIVYLKPLEGFTVEEVTEEKRRVSCKNKGQLNKKPEEK